MGPFRLKQRMFARGVATLAAYLFLLQAVFSGLAIASDMGQGDGFGVGCLTGKSGGDSGAPSDGGHRHGICCILHCSALDAPIGKPVVAVIRNSPLQSVALVAPPSAPIARVEPKHASQSPRAPPALSD